MRIDKNSWLITKPIAHRGLWGNGVPENSMLAYKLACAKNYPIEIDLYFTKDKEIVSFHDNNLLRMTGVDKKVWELTYNEISKLRLNDTEYTIPKFTEILELCDGKSPLLIEIKDQPDKTIVDEVVKLLKSYNGEFAVQSFNPLYINRVKKLAPEFIRGILAIDRDETLSKIKQSIVKNMSLNFLIKPDFISYYHNAYPLNKRKVKGKACLAWTITNKEQWEKVKPYVNNIIFENFSIN